MYNSGADRTSPSATVPPKKLYLYINSNLLFLHLLMFCGLISHSDHLLLCDVYLEIHFALCVCFVMTCSAWLAHRYQARESKSRGWTLSRKWPWRDVVWSRIDLWARYDVLRNLSWSWWVNTRKNLPGDSHSAMKQQPQEIWKSFIPNPRKSEIIHRTFMSAQGRGSGSFTTGNHANPVTSKVAFIAS